MLAVAGVVVSQQSGFFGVPMQGSLTTPTSTTDSSSNQGGYYFVDCNQACAFGPQGTATAADCQLTHNSICSSSSSTSSSSPSSLSSSSSVACTNKVEITPVQAYWTLNKKPAALTKARAEAQKICNTASITSVPVCDQGCKGATVTKKFNETTNNCVPQGTGVNTMWRCDVVGTCDVTRPCSKI